MSRPAGRAEESNAADQKLVDALMRLMADERIYRHDNITIGTLATKLGIPEYRLRRLINQRLGYRNFNVFLNNHRIEEAKAALADPTQAEVPVITIAMDAGFQSLGPVQSRLQGDHGRHADANIAASTRRRPDRISYCNLLDISGIGEAVSAFGQRDFQIRRAAAARIPVDGGHA